MYEQIPEELKLEQAWVNVYNYKKCPMQTDCYKGASVLAPDTWGTFEQAVHNTKLSVYDGIGYVFHNNGVLGIDIDCGFDDEGFLSIPAIDIIRRCRSYTERSRSGRGFHILVRGEIPFKGKNNMQGIEIYKDSRYFIMTGKKFMYSDIIENQEAVDYILRTYFSDDDKQEKNEENRIYNPVYAKPEGKTIQLRPHYPSIQEGGRHISLVSLAGQLHSQGYGKGHLYKELLYANTHACKPPLPIPEIERIVESVAKYRR